MKEIKKAPLTAIAFPCRLAKDPATYKNKPIFVRAIENTPEFNTKIGSNFNYIYVKPKEEREIKTIIKLKDTGDSIVLDENLSRKEGLEYAHNHWSKNLSSKQISVLHKKEKAKDVLAFDEENFEHIDKDSIDWKRIIERNITMKLQTIFEAMGWDMKEITLNSPKTTKRWIGKSWIEDEKY